MSAHPRKKPHQLTADETAALVSDLELRETLRTKALMRKYNASRSLINTVRMKSKMRLVPRGTKERNVLSSIGRPT